MFLESVETHFSTFTLSGFPSFATTERLEAQMLAEADLAAIEPPSSTRVSPTTFHLALAGGEPMGAAASTMGPLAELPLGLALQAAGVDVTVEVELPDDCCELVSLSVDPDAQRTTTGVTEALYRSFYRHAKQAGARSVVVGVDPWVFDTLTEQYGVPFTVLGPPLDLLGRELLAIGGEIALLEQGIRMNNPDFFAYLSLPAEGRVPVGAAPI
ncbi:MAG: GNAT family N-acetyltransferase [Aquihabitans sp.]